MFDSSTGWEPLESANTHRLSHRPLVLPVCLLVGVDSGDWTQVLTLARKAFCRPSHLPGGERCPHHPHWRRVCPGYCDNYFSHTYRIQSRCDWLGGPCRHPEGEGRWEIRGKWEERREEKETLGPLSLAIKKLEFPRKQTKTKAWARQRGKLSPWKRFTVCEDILPKRQYGACSGRGHTLAEPYLSRACLDMFISSPLLKA